MPPDRDTVIEVVLSGLAVVGFIVAVLYVGMAYGDGALSEQGALALVGLIVAFIVVMSAAGYWLSTREA